ncbi:hypothetical protein QYE76_028063 [Lolium multiflorum]|uniref:DUF4219 domain-containing protein n=1 Tax=Lolium multiflorum TaxID=4521 RepID=A0AAD8QL70_LOLMU|nr:hypothetical protein QYE76_028063 [Lolium multiflorum]
MVVVVKEVEEEKVVVVEVVVVVEEEEEEEVVVEVVVVEEEEEEEEVVVVGGRRRRRRYGSRLSVGIRASVGDQGENSAAGVAPKELVMHGGDAVVPCLEREDYALWAINMKVAMEVAEIWEEVGSGGAKYENGAEKYTKD